MKQQIENPGKVNSSFHEHTKLHGIEMTFRYNNENICLLIHTYLLSLN